MVKNFKLVMSRALDFHGPFWFGRGRGWTAGQVAAVNLTLLASVLGVSAGGAVTWVQMVVVVCVLISSVPKLDNSIYSLLGFSCGSDEESAYNPGDPGLTPGSGRSHGEGNNNPLLYSCLDSSMDRGAWWATVHRVSRSWARLND